MSLFNDEEDDCNITAVAMDADCMETTENQSDGEKSDVTLRGVSDSTEYDDRDRTYDTSAGVNDSAFADSVEVVEHKTELDVNKPLQIRSEHDVEHDQKPDDMAEKYANHLDTDHCKKKTDSSADFQDRRLASCDADNTTETIQSQASLHENWQPSNPFLGVSNNADSGDCVTPKSVSSSSFVHNLAMLDVSDGVTDSSPMSTSAQSDMMMGYSKLRESAASSVCSASPYESPTHTISGAAAMDSATEMAGSRPDSLYLSRSILQERERQWLAKKGSYSSLSECDSSPAGSMDALIEAATSTPLHAQGTVSMDGDMITFVADGINELIKRSRGG